MHHLDRAARGPGTSAGDSQSLVALGQSGCVVFEAGEVVIFVVHGDPDEWEQ
jgi:hypothetical protein